MALSPKQLCDIIAKAGECGVSSLTYGDLHLSFIQKIEEESGGGPLPVISKPESVPRETFSEEEDRETYLGELLLSNPAQYELELEKEALNDGENDKGTKPVLRRG